MTGYIISYQQQDGGHNGSVIAENSTSAIISGLMSGATYNISIVATSSTVPSTEITVHNVTLG